MDLRIWLAGTALAAAIVSGSPSASARQRPGADAPLWTFEAGG